ncbi:MAG: electron transfer flavoprotein subunit alpha/FixB family protein [Deltaproteobacteria bacterium]|nr:electron transfer flavoprotein subunit alpha/FixB family protein [Deltaproteobacteria bacterium]
MSSGILVLCDHDGGAFKSTALELIGKARELVPATGGTITALVLGHVGGDGLPADQVLAVTGPEFGTYDTGAWTAAMAAAIAKADPALVLATASVLTKDFMPRVAARLGLGLATEVVGLEVRDGAVVGRRPVYAGKAIFDVTVTSVPALFTVRPNSFPVPAAGGSPPVTALDVAIGPNDRLTRVVETLAPQNTTVDLTEASVIVSGGRAVKSAEGFDTLIRPLAAAFGAAVGSSRASVDAGYAPQSEQVGQTGKTVNPSLYVAMGISGAIQHLAGMRTSKVIVAVNKDPEAPIFQFATYGIVDDIFTIGPLLAEEVKAALAR